LVVRKKTVAKKPERKNRLGPMKSKGKDRESREHTAGFHGSCVIPRYKRCRKERKKRTIRSRECGFEKSGAGNEKRWNTSRGGTGKGTHTGQGTESEGEKKPY